MTLYTVVAHETHRHFATYAEAEAAYEWQLVKARANGWTVYLYKIKT